MTNAETLIETLEKRLQEEYREGAYIDQQMVHEFTFEEFKDAGGAEAFGIEDDEEEIKDFLLDEVIGNITICL